MNPYSSLSPHTQSMMSSPMIPLYAYGCFLARTRDPPNPAFFGPGTHFVPRTHASNAALAVNAAARFLASASAFSPAPTRNDIVRISRDASSSSSSPPPRAMTTQNSVPVRSFRRFATHAVVARRPRFVVVVPPAFFIASPTPLANVAVIPASLTTAFALALASSSFAPRISHRTAPTLSLIHI